MVTIIIALFSASEKALCVLVICDSEWLTVSLHSAFSISTEVVSLQRCLVVTWLVSRKTAAIWAHELCTPYSQAHTSLHAAELRGMLGIKTASGYQWERVRERNEEEKRRRDQDFPSCPRCLPFFFCFFFCAFFPYDVYGACLLKVRALRAIQHWANTAFDLALTLLFPKVTLLFPKVSIVPFFFSFSVWIVRFLFACLFSCYVYLRQRHRHLQLSRTIPAGDKKKKEKKKDRCRPRSNCLTRLSSCSSHFTMKRNQTIEFLLSLLFRRADGASVSYPLKSTLCGVLVALLPCRCASDLTIWNRRCAPQGSH